jgi:hypothetical protein
LAASLAFARPAAIADVRHFGAGLEKAMGC